MMHTPSRVLVLYNDPILPPDHPDAESEREILFTVEEVSKPLRQAGHDVVVFGVGREPSVLQEGLKGHAPDVVFNLFEGLADRPSTEAVVAGMLEWLGFPFTGSPAHTLTIAHQKHVAKSLFFQANLPTPPYFVVDGLPVQANALGWPVIVKPAAQDASVGINQNSVVTTPEALEQQVAWVLENYGPPVLVEQFIPGRELSLSVIEMPELTALPFFEINFTGADQGLWPIYDYQAKWIVESSECDSAPITFGVEIEEDLKQRLHHLAFRAFRLLGCRDYARVDFRVDPAGRPYILEVNPNPDISPEAGLAICLEEMKLSNEGFILHLVERALARRTPSAAMPPFPANGFAGLTSHDDRGCKTSDSSLIGERQSV